MPKKIIILIVLLIFILISYISYQYMWNNYIPVLAYHSVLENPTEETDVSLKNFEKQMAYLSKHHYQSLSIDEYNEWKNGKKIKGKKVLITFDDGKSNFYTNALPILEKYNLKATMFVIGSGIDVDGYLTKNQITSLNDSINIENHSYNLHNETSAKSNDFNLYNADLLKTKDYNYEYFAYPFGITNDNYQNALKQNNYKLAFLYSPSHWSNKKMDNYNITRVPIYKSNSLLKFILKVSIAF